MCIFKKIIKMNETFHCWSGELLIWKDPPNRTSEWDFRAERIKKTANVYHGKSISKYLWIKALDKHRASLQPYFPFLCGTMKKKNTEGGGNIWVCRVGVAGFEAYFRYRNNPPLIRACFFKIDIQLEESKFILFSYFFSSKFFFF